MRLVQLENFAGSTVSEGGFLTEHVFFGLNPSNPTDRTGIDNNDPNNWGELIMCVYVLRVLMRSYSRFKFVKWQYCCYNIVKAVNDAFEK